MATTTDPRAAAEAALRKTGLPPAPPVPPKIDESVLQVGQLFTVLAQDPKYRGRVLEMLNEAAPHVVIPELEVARDAQAKIEAATKPLKEENAKLGERLGALEGNLSRARWMEQHGVDDEEMVEIEKMAKERKIGDPQTALEYFRGADLGRPRGERRDTHVMTEESRKELYKRPKEWYEKKAYEILAESRRRRGA